MTFLHEMIPPVERGIKIWERCDLGMIHDLDVYAARNSDSERKTLGGTVALRIAKGIRVPSVASCWSSTDCALRYVSRRMMMVMAFSNCHHASEARRTRRLKDCTLEGIDCPELIPCYNRIIGGVDLADQKEAPNKKSDRKSGKWWLALRY